MDPISVRDIKADGNARIHVGNSSVTHVHNYAEGQVPEQVPLPYSLIPFSRDPDFVARGDILTQIADRCGEPGGRAALVGLGGVGKSQLSIEYAYQTTDKSKNIWVFWVHAGTRARVEGGFRAIADAVKLQDRHAPKADIPQLLHAWLSDEKNGKWLMILDSADDHEVFYTAEPGSGRPPLVSYLPQSPNGSVLVTTRDHGFAFKLTGKYQNVIKVGPMEPEEALLFLEKRLGTPSEPEIAAELVNALDCIPLAINQASSYIQARAPRCTIKKYLADFRESEKKSAKLLAHDAAELRRDGSASNAIMKTWQISFDHIRSKQPSAADLLSLMSFFDYQSIPEAALNPEDDYDSDFDSDLESNAEGDELANQFSHLHLIDAKKRRSQTPSNSDFDSDSEDDSDESFEDDIAMLRNFCLISVNETGTNFEMHRLVQLATKKWLAATKQHERFKQLFIHRVCMVLPAPESYNFVLYSDIVVHMQIAADYRPNKTNSRAWCCICYRLSWFRLCKGLCNEAKDPIQRAIAVWEQRKGPEHSYSFGHRKLLANIFLDLNHLAESESILDEILATQKRILGEGDHSTLGTMVALANNYVQQGRFDEAENLEIRAVELAKKTFGPEDRATLTYMTCLSRTYTKQGRLEEAESLDLASLEMSKKVFGPSHFETLGFMAVLAGTYQLQGRHDEALELDLRLLRLATAAPRPDNIMISQCMSRISYSYRTKQMYTEAEEMDKGAVELSTVALGPYHLATLQNMVDLALSHQHQGHEEEANAILLDILAKTESQQGMHDAYTISCMDSASTILCRQRQFEKASELQTQILSYRKNTLGDTHPDTIEVMIELAISLGNQDKFEEAMAIYTAALPLLEAKLGFQHRDTLNVAYRLAKVYAYGMEAHLEAVPLLERVFEAQAVKFGADHSKSLQTLKILAASRSAVGLLKEAEECQRHILAIQISSLGAKHLRTLGIMTDLAKTLRERNNFAEAEMMLLEAVAGYKDSPKSRTTRAPLALQQLGHLYASQDRFDEAVQAFVDASELYQSASKVDHASAFSCHFMEGCIYFKQGKLDEAEKKHIEILENQRTLFGPDHRETLETQRMLAIVLFEKGEAAEAVAMLINCAEKLDELFGPEDEDAVYVRELLAEADAYDEDGNNDTPEDSDSQVL